MYIVFLVKIKSAVMDDKTGFGRASHTCTLSQNFNFMSQIKLVTTITAPLSYCYIKMTLTQVAVNLFTLPCDYQHLLPDKSSSTTCTTTSLVY